MLEINHFGSLEIRDIGTKFVGRIRQHQHPTKMAVPKAPFGVVWIKVGVGVTMMDAMASTPPLDRALHRCRPTKTEKETHDGVGSISTMRPQAVVSSRDTKPSKEIIDHRENSCVESERGVETAVQREKWNTNEDD
eukprot:Lithocolla_globosa_v1_NODE_3516_length_1651_cov_2.508772.p2 type:complete len:136 gc:universal NODE_3516_length_1651_cov_2.508772:566-973(+)